MQNFRAASTTDYFPSDTETEPRFSTNGNGNGQHHGNGKIFTLKPATDPDTLAILDARRRVLAEPNARLNRPAKACFCEILDRALNPSFFDCKGVVTISDSVLAQTFGVSNRTIFTWKRRLEASGHVWTSQKFKSNMWPITTYHLTCLHKPRQEGKTDADGTYGAGAKSRALPAEQPLGARHPGQPGLPLPGSRTPPPEAKSAVLQGISGETRQKLPVSPEENFGSDPKKTSGETRRKLRARPEENFGRDPKKTSGETRSQLRARPEADCRHIETQNEEKGTSETLERSTGLNAQKAGQGRKPASPENLFLLDVAAMLERWRKGSSKAELNNSGAWWRLGYRADADLMGRVLAETLRAVKESQVKTSPGQYAADLWKRWGGKL